MINTIFKISVTWLECGWGADRVQRIGTREKACGM